MKLNKKGISLIVLVITIIVMIILATAIILSLNSSNIVEKAKEAKTASDMANAKNVVAVALGEWELMTSAERAKYDNFAEYAETKLQETGYKVDENGGLNVSSNGVVSTIYVGADNRQAIIPEGFTVSTKATEDSVTEGLVISDSKGNEFVWVPVDDFSKFERTTTYNGTITAPGDWYTEPFSKTTDDGITLSLSNDLTGEWAEYAEMRASVQENKGFYIGRYEAGKEGTDTLVIKKGATVWNNIFWGTSMINVGTEGAVYYSRQMYKSSSSVVSTLCYGVQWDAALQFIAKTDAQYPTVVDTNKGYYAYDMSGNEINPTELKPAGYYSVNNIYDMSGNALEWSMETYTFCSTGDNNEIIEVTAYGILRGTNLNDRPNAACARYESLRNGPDVIGGKHIVSFRVALYLK